MTTLGTGWTDGNLNLSVALEHTGPTPLPIRDVRLRFPLSAELAQFAMGIDRPGGFRERNATVEWEWGTAIKRQNFMVASFPSLERRERRCCCYCCFCRVFGGYFDS